MRPHKAAPVRPKLFHRAGYRGAATGPLSYVPRRRRLRVQSPQKRILTGAIADHCLSLPLSLWLLQSLSSCPFNNKVSLEFGVLLLPSLVSEHLRLCWKLVCLGGCVKMPGSCHHISLSSLFFPAYCLLSPFCRFPVAVPLASGVSFLMGVVSPEAYAFIFLI